MTDHPPIRTGTPAYDAVYAYIRDLGEAMPPDTAHRNALIWRGVQAAVEAMQATYTPPPPGSDRDALPEHLRGLIWPHMRPYTSTACETARACFLAGEVHRDHANELRAWEAREHAACRITRKQDMANCDCNCHATAVGVEAPRPISVPLLADADPPINLGDHLTGYNDMLNEKGPTT